MKKDIMEGNWKRLSGKARVEWGKLAVDDLDVIDGRATELACKIQEHYGVERNEAERQMDEWQKSMDS